MKVGNLVKMDFEGTETWKYDDVWGVGIIVTIEDRTPDDVEVLWAGGHLSWEMKIMLEVVNETR
tara:strand:- start:210 stop:401 length:192 start_codon:yes stop_codon:yes gene_type:complete